MILQIKDPKFLSLGMGELASTEKDVMDILRGNQEYLTAHPEKKLIITCQWNESLNTWELLAFMIDTGSEKTESKCTENTSCVQQTSPSDQKEPSLKHLLGLESYATLDHLLNQTNINSTSQSTGDGHCIKDEEDLSSNKNCTSLESLLSSGFVAFQKFKNSKITSFGIFLKED